MTEIEKAILLMCFCLRTVCRINWNDIVVKFWRIEKFRIEDEIRYFCINEHTGESRIITWSEYDKKNAIDFLEEHCTNE